jgi:hypothetical protein
LTRGAAWRISSPLTTLTAAGVSSSETVVGAAVTTMVCSSRRGLGRGDQRQKQAGSAAVRTERIFIKLLVKRTKWNICIYVNPFVKFLKIINVILVK